MEQDNHSFEYDLKEAERLLQKAANDASAPGEEYSLEEILSEYGAGGDTESAADSGAVSAEVPDEPSVAEEEAPEEAREIGLQEMLEKTVQSVLEDQAEEPVIEESKARKLRFFRHDMQDTEELYDHVPKKEVVPAAEADDASALSDDEPIDEPDAGETAHRHLQSAKRYRAKARTVAILTVVLWVPLILSHFGWMPALYDENPLLHFLPFLAVEGAVCILGSDVFTAAFGAVRNRKVNAEVLTVLSGIVTMADTVLAFFFRTAGQNEPFHAVACTAMAFTLIGYTMREQALYDNLRLVSKNVPAYTVGATAGGAAKGHSDRGGFITAIEQDSPATHWQSLILPIVLTATFVFSVLATVKNQDGLLFFWNWSAVLAGANSLSFSLGYALPLYRLSRRIAKSGGALAGYTGAKQLSESNCIILTDSDLFPPGTLTIRGVKVFGEEDRKIISYAATMAKAAECGLDRLFGTLMDADGGQAEAVSDLNFYEEGGVMGTIHGETVLFGTKEFCTKMNVVLPKDLSLKTGVFLAIDGTLAALFAVKYMPAENVSWALHALKHNRLTPVLAVRDGNITPELLRRKFGTNAGAVFPRLSTRLALSAPSSGTPYAFLLREGLMPFAEAVIGAKRLCRAVRCGTVRSFIFGVFGTIIAFYLTFNATYRTLTPLSMLAFLLLGAVASLLNGFNADRY